MEKPYSEHNLEWTIDAGLEFIEDSVKAGSGQPFYLLLCTTLVHGPDRSWSRSIGEPLVSGSGLEKEAIEPEGMLTRKTILDELSKRGLDPDKGHAGYSWIDAGIGAVLAKLEKLGIDDEE